MLTLLVITMNCLFLIDKQVRACTQRQHAAIKEKFCQQRNVNSRSVWAGFLLLTGSHIHPKSDNENARIIVRQSITQIQHEKSFPVEH